MKTKHTPTPWKFDGESINDLQGNTVAFPRSGGFMPGHRDENLRANAAHIVKCVNLHDELVDALALCQKDFKGTNAQQIKVIDLLDRAKAGV